MLGPFYRRVWDLNRQAQEDQHYFNSMSSGSHHIDISMKRRHSSLSSKMNLPNGEQTVHASGVGDEHVEKKVQRNGASKTRGQDSHTNGHNGATQTNAHVSEANEVQIPFPNNLALEGILDTILTAWSILMRRYQRDAFHQFTWGLKGTTGSDKTQCISASGLDMLSLTTAGSLKTSVSEARSKSLSIDRATFMVNDGTREEVQHISIQDPGRQRLMRSSGHSRFPPEFSKTRCTLPHDGRRQPCLNTKPWDNFISFLPY
jgi:hypothetical protein